MTRQKSRTPRANAAERQLRWPSEACGERACRAPVLPQANGESSRVESSQAAVRTAARDDEHEREVGEPRGPGLPVSLQEHREELREDLRLDDHLRAAE
jgi:hypothetical protein